MQEYLESNNKLGLVQHMSSELSKSDILPNLNNIVFSDAVIKNKHHLKTASISVGPTFCTVR